MGVWDSRFAFLGIWGRTHCEKGGGTPQELYHMSFTRDASSPSAAVSKICSLHQKKMPKL